MHGNFSEKLFQEVATGSFYAAFCTKDVDNNETISEFASIGSEE